LPDWIAVKEALQVESVRCGLHYWALRKSSILLISQIETDGFTLIMDAPAKRSTDPLLFKRIITTVIQCLPCTILAVDFDNRQETMEQIKMLSDKPLSVGFTKQRGGAMPGLLFTSQKKHSKDAVMVDMTFFTERISGYQGLKIALASDHVEELVARISADGTECIRIARFQHAGVLLHFKFGHSCKYKRELERAQAAAKMCATAVDYVAAVINLFKLIGCDLGGTDLLAAAWTLASLRETWPACGLAVDSRALSELSDSELMQEYHARWPLRVREFAAKYGVNREIFGRWVHRGKSNRPEDKVMCADAVRKWIAASRIQL
jgi:hypothetical protein